jgi:hypothetical protein
MNAPSKSKNNVPLSSTSVEKGSALKNTEGDSPDRNETPQ